MLKTSPSIDSHRLPPKTTWTILWFIVLGLVGMVWTRSSDNDPVARLLSENGKVEPARQWAALPLPQQRNSAIPDGLTDLIDGRGAGRHATGQRPKEQTQLSIEDPDSRALCSFYTALDKVERDVGQPLARVHHYGDSLLARDALTGTIRKTLQQRFGDGGHGFVLLGMPWKWYRHEGVRHGARGKWRPRPLTYDPVPDGMYGLGGVAFETRHPGAVAWAGTVDRGPIGTKVSSFDVSYLLQPGGGHFEMLVEDRVIKTVSTRAAGTAREAAHTKITVPEGQHKLKIRTTGDGAVRIFGATLASGQRGVVYDNLAISGASAQTLSRYNPDHWKSELKHHRSDLVVLMFGANEGHNKNLNLGDYKQQFLTVLQTVRQGTADSSCLVIGPLDQAKRKRNGRLTSRRMPLRVNKIQREIALMQGCAYYDTWSAMGGTNSMIRWFRQGLGGGDFIHPTDRGSRMIGTWLADALLSGYQTFIQGGKKCASSVTSL